MKTRKTARGSRVRRRIVRPVGTFSSNARSPLRSVPRRPLFLSLARKSELLSQAAGLGKAVSGTYLLSVHVRLWARPSAGKGRHHLRMPTRCSSLDLALALQGRAATSVKPGAAKPGHGTLGSLKTHQHCDCEKATELHLKW